MRDQVTKIAASSDLRGQSAKMERLAEKARAEGAEALALLGNLSAGGGEPHEYAEMRRMVGEENMPAFYVPGQGTPLSAAT